jgi:hypothetical protein
MHPCMSLSRSMPHEQIRATCPCPCCMSMSMLHVNAHTHRWASTLISMSAISDIDICYSDIGDKYVGLNNIIPISEVFWYWHQSSFRYPTLRNKNLSSRRFEPAPLAMVSEHYNIMLLCLYIQIGMSDIGYWIKLNSISDIMWDSALSVRYRKFRYQAQSDIADHRYRTKCPPMPMLHVNVHTACLVLLACPLAC